MLKKIFVTNSIIRSLESADEEHLQDTFLAHVIQIYSAILLFSSI
jgi:hypothetical protein